MPPPHSENHAPFFVNGKISSSLLRVNEAILNRGKMGCFVRAEVFLHGVEDLHLTHYDHQSTLSWLHQINGRL